MSEPEPLRGICFDLWNTLAFTEVSPNPIAALAEAFGVTADPGWRKAVERVMMTRRLTGISEAIDALARSTGHWPVDPSRRRDLILMWGRASNLNRLYPDALPALRAVRGLPAPRRLKIGILSNSQSFDLDFLRRDGLEAAVDEICLSCDCGLLKPEPEIFRHAEGRMGLPPEQLLMVGDNLLDDVRGATAAGWRAWLLDRAARSSEPGTIRDLMELPARLISFSS